MFDDPKKAHERKLIGAIAMAVMDHQETADNVPTTAALENRLSALIADHGAHLSEIDRARFETQAEILVTFFKMAPEFKQAHAENDQARLTALVEEQDRLRTQLDEISAYRGFPQAAEQLSKAVSFDAFCASLPDVNLNRTYGNGSKKLSPFPLIWAMRTRDRPLERVQLMVHAGAGIGLRTLSQDTVLHAMAKMKRTAKVRLSVLRFLIFTGADLEAVNHAGQTPLSCALAEGSVEDVGNFLAVGANITLPHLETAAQNPKKLRLVLDHLDGSAETAGMIAQLGKQLRWEVVEAKADLERTLEHGTGPQMVRKRYDDLQASQMILRQMPGYQTQDAGAKVSWQQESAAFSAIEHATDMGAYRFALWQVDITSYPADNINQPIYWPLQAAEGRVERLTLMLDAGASTAGGPNGEALHILAEMKHRNEKEQSELATLLVQAGAQIEARNYRNFTPLACAVSSRGLAETRALLKVGANPNVCVPWGDVTGPAPYVPLLFVAAEDVRLFRCLLRHGAKADARSSDGESLSSYLERELATETASLERGNMSGNLARHVQRRAHYLSKSLDVLQSV